MFGLRNFLKKLGGNGPGFRMHERMSGEHQFTDAVDQDGTHPMSFEIDWGPSSILRWFNPATSEFLRHPMSGEVSVGGLCQSTDLSGTMTLRYFTDSKIYYDFQFEVNGTNYQYSGEKRDLRPTNFHSTHRTLHGQIRRVHDDVVISNSTLYFHWKDLPSMLASFRLN